MTVERREEHSEVVSYDPADVGPVGGKPLRPHTGQRPLAATHLPPDVGRSSSFSR